MQTITLWDAAGAPECPAPLQLQVQSESCNVAAYKITPLKQAGAAHGKVGTELMATMRTLQARMLVWACDQREPMQGTPPAWLLNKLQG